MENGFTEIIASPE